MLCTATEPSEDSGVKKKIQHKFKTAPDGRLIIHDNDEEDGKAGKPGRAGKRQRGTHMDAEENLEDLLDTIEAAGKVRHDVWREGN